MWKRAAIVLAGLIVLAGAAGVALLRQSQQPRVLRTITLEGGGHVLQLDQRTGYAFVSTPAAFNNNRGLVRIVDTRSGTVVRRISLPDVSAITFDDTTGQLFAAYALAPVSSGSAPAGKVVMLDGRGGRIERTIPLAGNPGDVAVDSARHRAFVGVTNSSTCIGGVCRSSRVVVLDTRNGMIVRQFAIRGYVGPLAIDRTGNRLVAISYVRLGSPTPSNTMLLFDTTTGRLIAGQPIPGQPGATFQNTLFVDSTSGHVFLSVNTPNGGGSVIDMIDTRSGRLLGTVPMSSAVVRIVADERRDVVFALTLGPIIRRFVPTVNGPIASGEGQLYVLDGRTGQVEHTFRACLIPLAVAVDTRRGHLLVVCDGQIYWRSTGGTVFDGPGLLKVLDERTGALLFTAPLGVFPQQMVVDGQSGHAVVVDQGGTVRAPDAWGWVPAPVRRWLPFIPRPTGGTRRMSADLTIVDVSR